jgi:hypothetical protein
MIRSELCALVRMSVPAFNSHLQAGDVPFETDGAGEVRDANGRTWSNFGLHHATALLATHQLVGAGLNWREAAWTLREPRVPVPRSAAVPPGEHFVARAEFERDGGGAPEFRPRVTVYAGPLGDIVLAARREVESYNRQSARTAWQRISLVAFMACDLGRARRVAEARAEEMGLSPEQVLRVDPEAEAGVAGSKAR